jgi:hypothetical protein
MKKFISFLLLVVCGSKMILAQLVKTVKVEKTASAGNTIKTFPVKSLLAIVKLVWKKMYARDRSKCLDKHNQVLPDHNL